METTHIMGQYPLHTIVLTFTNEFKRSGKTINKYLEDFDKEDKGTCYAICLKEPVKNTVKRKVKVEHVLYDGTRKWELTYVVRTYDSIVSRHPTKTEAVERAKRKTEETGIRTTVEMEKKLVTGSSTVAIVKSESKTNEKLGEWVLFGWAYC